jgi:hypothetical protein
VHILCAQPRSPVSDKAHADKRKACPELVGRASIRISPFLTSHAYQFWRKKEHYFDSMFYRRG